MASKKCKIDDAFLISIVERYEEIYNLHHPQYSNQQRRDSIWEEIGSLMNHEGFICKERWVRIRDNFRKALNLRRTKRNKGDNKIKAPRFNSELSFLMPFIAAEENKRSKKSESETDEETISSIRGDLRHQERPSTLSPLNVTYTPVYSPDCDAQTHSSNFRREQAASSSSYKNDDSDPLIDFFMTMAKTVKTFPVQEQLKIKGELFQAVNNAEMRLATSSNLHVTSTNYETILPSISQPSSQIMLPDMSASSDVKREELLHEHDAVKLFACGKNGQACPGYYNYPAKKQHHVLLDVSVNGEPA